MSRVFSSFWKDYELLDAGGERKLERWGNIITIRPDRNAYFKPVLSKNEWIQKAHFEFVEETRNSGEWNQIKNDVPTNWQVQYRDITLNIKLTKFKHLGIFPEQQLNWEYIENNIRKDDRFLNLFGYTAAASLVARINNAEVFHCDSVKQIISWSKENMESSGLSDIHWVLEDALKFAQREVKRGHTYDGIVMDPPAFGIGAKKERWKIEDKFPDLLKVALELRNDNGFIIANTYSPRLDEKRIRQIARDLTSNEKIEIDTLCFKTKTGKIIEYGQRTLITS
jgi:23S rRNA (cytosine1962-C5)-methyltransferase